MKLKFNKVCIDKNTGKQYRVGDIVEFDDKRGEEILRSSFAVELEAEKKPTPKKATKKKGE